MIVHQLQIIKQTIEKVSGVKDIGGRSRIRFYSDLKKTYYKIANELTSSSLALSGEVLGGYDHASAYHGLRTFDELYGSVGFTCNDIYYEAKSILLRKKEFQKYARFINIAIDELEKIHRVKVIKIIEKNSKVIQNASRLAIENAELKEEIRVLKGMLQ